jgi:hypothetical protein
VLEQVLERVLAYVVRKQLVVPARRGGIIFGYSYLAIFSLGGAAMRPVSEESHTTVQLARALLAIVPICARFGFQSSEQESNSSSQCHAERAE